MWVLVRLLGLSSRAMDRWRGSRKTMNGLQRRLVRGRCISMCTQPTIPAPDYSPRGPVSIHRRCRFRPVALMSAVFGVLLLATRCIGRRAERHSPRRSTESHADTMKRITITVVSASLLLFAAMPASAATRSHKTISMCPPADDYVLLADVQAVIYTVRENRFEFSEGKRTVVPIVATRGCDLSSKRSFRLGWEFANAGSAESGSPIPLHLTLGGSFVAYEEFFSKGNRYSEGRDEEYVEEWHVIVRNLRTGRVLHRVATGARERDHPKLVGDGSATAIVVKADGAVAWITDTVQNENRYQVHALDETGERTLAVGSNIDPNSLALAGSTLYWTQGGKSFSAPLN